MAKGSTCGDCRYLLETDIEPGSLKRIHYCRRYPKSVCIGFTPDGQMVPMTGNPPEAPDSPACGEFRGRGAEGILS